jgi:hypothetical protein
MPDPGISNCPAFLSSLSMVDIERLWILRILVFLKLRRKTYPNGKHYRNNEKGAKICS